MFDYFAFLNLKKDSCLLRNDRIILNSLFFYFSCITQIQSQSSIGAFIKSSHLSLYTLLGLSHKLANSSNIIAASSKCFFKYKSIHC